MTNRGARSRRPAVRLLLASLLAMALAILGLPAAGASADTGSTHGTAVLKVGSVITMTSSSNPTPPNKDVTLTATFAVVAGNSDVSPAGDVTFLDDGVEIGTGALSGQSASWTGPLPLGTHPITASYVGDDNYTAGTSDPFALTIGFVPTLSISVTGDISTLPNDGSWSGDINVGATSDPADNDYPHTRFTVAFSGITDMTAANLALQQYVSGNWQNVMLTDAGSGLLTAVVGADTPLASGAYTGVKLRLKALDGAPVGALSMGASLLSSPDGVDWSAVLATASRPFTVEEGSTPLPTTTTVTASNVQTDGTSAPVQLKASVLPSDATGTVTFMADGSAVWAAQLSGGIAIANPTLGLGSHTISASYSGDSHHATSTGTQQQLINVTPPGGSLHAIVPVRILDTRNGTGAPKAQLKPNETLNLKVAGAGIPTTGVLGISVNVTVVQPIATGFVTLYPTGGAVPGTANIDFPKVVNTSGLVITDISASGYVTIVNHSAGLISLIADVSAWFSQQTGSIDSQGRYNPVTPLRILDTRTGIGVPKAKIKPNQTLSMKVAGKGEIPPAGVGAAMLNVTIVNPDLPVYLVLYPSGGTLPHVSTNAFQKGETRAARVIVGVGTDGYVKVFSPYATADVVIDVVGWFTKGSPTAVGSGPTFVPLPVSKRLTSIQTGGLSWGVNVSKPIAIAGIYGIPGISTAIHPLAAVTNLHVSAPVLGGYLAAYPAEPRAAGSDLNFVPGQVVQNLGVTKLGPNGAFYLFSTAQTNVTIDIYGWFG